MTSPGGHPHRWISAVLVATELLLTLGGGVSSAAASRSRIAWGGLWTSDHAGGDPLRIAESGDFPDYPHNPKWSHSGAWIAYVRSSGVWIVRSDGTDARQLSNTTTLYGWSPDDSSIYVNLGVHVTWLAVNGGAYGPVLPPVDQRLEHFVAVSPDGQRVAVSVEVGSTWGVQVSTSPHIERRIVISGAGTDYHPIEWSPDGRKLLLLVRVGTERFDVVTVSPDGTGPTTLRRNAIAESWSPDGKRILFRDGGTYGLFTMRADGTGVTELPGMTGEADWGPGTVDDPSPTTAPPPTSATSTTGLTVPPIPPGTRAPTTSVPAVTAPNGLPTPPPSEPVGDVAVTADGFARNAALGAEGIREDQALAGFPLGRSRSRTLAIAGSVALLALVGVSLGRHVACR